jgi:hypothetical protein
MLTMSIRTRQKINQLQHILPEGLFVDSAWLQEHGYSRPLIAKYVRSGWLESPASRIYRRPKAREDGFSSWEEAIASLQTLLDLPFKVGGRTALELQGYAHYSAPSGPTEIHLYGNIKPPKWLICLPLKQKLVFRNAHLFQAEKNSADDFSIQSWGTMYGTLVISTPERAILEVLDEIPQHETFHQADMLMQGLTNLSPRRLNKLLANCRSIKAKRLFLWFAKRHNYPWFARLNQSKIDLGSGKRMLVPGGQLDNKYLITVPKDLSINGQ